MGQIANQMAWELFLKIKKYMKEKIHFRKEPKEHSANSEKEEKK